MAFIPLHAAGLYFRRETEECLADYAVISYTPAYNSLNRARSLHPQNTLLASALDVLLVAEPDAPGLKCLPNSLAELAELRSLLPAASIVQPADGERWTAEAVYAAIPRVSVLHLACHGQQDKVDALQSGFFIGDRKLTIQQIMRLKISNAQLAFLSACETAKGDTLQPDESINLATTMMFIGFPSVVATMW